MAGRFHLGGKGTLEPVVRQDVFANVDGIVDKIPDGIEHGAFVKENDLLVKLRSTQITTALQEVTGKRNATSEELRSVQRELATGKMLKPEERNRLIGRQAELNQTWASLDAEWQLYKAKEAELEVHSPISGQIITWDVRNRLRSRPVQSGDQLMQLADPADRWRLEVHMPENRMGHISDAQRTLKNENLDVSYILAATGHDPPRQDRRGRPQCRGADSEEGNTVLIYVELDKTEMEQLRQEQKLKQVAEVTAKVYCGSRPLGYVLLHDLIEFVQSKIFFRYS